jgi:hypothetical protein
MVVAMKKKSSMPDSNDGSHQGTFIMKLQTFGLQTFQCCASDKFLKKMKDKQTILGNNFLRFPKGTLSTYQKEDKETNK